MAKFLPNSHVCVCVYMSVSQKKIHNRKEFAQIPPFPNKPKSLIHLLNSLYNWLANTVV